jgi:orotate phosphoribosyltransferase
MTGIYDKRVAAPYHTRDLYTSAQFPKIVDETVKAVRKLKKKHKFTALAASGNSGIPLLGAVCARLKMPMLVVRKTKDTQNDSSLVNGEMESGGKYLIIDDLISTGATVERIVRNIQSESDTLALKEPMVPAAVLLWYSNCRAEYAFEKVTVPVYDLKSLL